MTRGPVPVSFWLKRKEEENCMVDPLAKEIIRGGIRQYWDLSYDKIEVCRDCEYRYACHDCRPLTYGLTGELTAKSLHCSYDPYRGKFVDMV